MRPLFNFRTLIFFVTVCVAVVKASAATHYVSTTNNSPAPPFTSWATAATNIQDAIAACTTNDQVLVADGIYRATADSLTNVITTTNTIVLTSVNGAASTIIDGEHRLRCAQFAGSTKVNGFTFSNGFASTGAGILCNSSAIIVSNSTIISNVSSNNGGGAVFGTFYNCLFMSNVALPFSSGGGVSGSTLNNCSVLNNTAGYYGGGMYGGTATSCLIASNSAAEDGGGVWAANLTSCTVSFNAAGGSGGGAYNGSAVNCTLNDNAAGSWGGGFYGSTAYGCAVVRNSADTGGGAYDALLASCTVVGNVAVYSGGGADDCTMSNTICYYNNAPNGPNYLFESFTPKVNYCCTAPLPTIGVSNITAEPLLASDFHLSTNSPCRAAGTTNSTPFRDIDGERWFNPPSIGCDQFNYTNSTNPISISIGAPYTRVAADKEIPLTLIGIGELTASDWDLGDGTIISNKPFISHAWHMPGDYVVTARGYNKANPQGVATSISISVVPAPVHFVSLDSANPTPPYDSWDIAATNLQDAIDATTVAGAVVLVNDGVYSPPPRSAKRNPTRVVIDKPIIVRSVNGSSQTFIDSKNAAARVVYLGDGATLDGFTVQNGYSLGWGAGIFCYSTNSSILNCVVASNTCPYTFEYGAGIVSGFASNCVFHHNSNNDRGGAAAYSLLQQCYAYSNSAARGGVTFKCDATQCVFANNTAGSGAGAADGTLNRCVLSNNYAINGGGGAIACAISNSYIVNNSTDWYGAGASLSTVVNSVLLRNTGKAGGGADNSTLLNCTIISNTATTYSGGDSFAGKLTNCIIQFNSAAVATNSSNTVAYCCVTPIVAGPGNFTNDPAFTDLAKGNLRLESASPCINAGTAIAVGATDLDGRPRNVSQIDVGAYEFQGTNMSEFIGWLQSFNYPVDGSADFVDSDNDGLNNWQEFLASTAPDNSSSVLRLIAETSPDGITVTWDCVPGRFYRLEYSDDLGPTSWQTLIDDLWTTEPTMSVVDAFGIPEMHRFYRVTVLP